jgi:hypothetical protein
MLADVPGTAVIEADIRQPAAVLDHPQTHRLIDFAQPVALLMVAVIQFVLDHDDPWAMVRRYIDAFASGSYLVLSAPTGDHKAGWRVDRTLAVYAASSTSAIVRTKAEFARFFNGLEIVSLYDGAGCTVAHVGLWERRMWRQLTTTRRGGSTLRSRGNPSGGPLLSARRARMRY